MSELVPKGINRYGLDAAFEALETEKSNLILQGQLLLVQQQADAAAEHFAKAAVLEEDLSNRCASQGLHEKSWIHGFSAASCWARAGDFHTAICLGEQLLTEPRLPPQLRQRIEAFTQTLRQRRQEWGVDLVLAGGAE